MALLLLLGLSWRPPFPVTPISNGYHSTAGGVVGPGDRSHRSTPLQSPISQTLFAIDQPRPSQRPAACICWHSKSFKRSHPMHSYAWGVNG